MKTLETTPKQTPLFFKKQTTNKQIKTSKRHSIALIVMSSLSLFALLVFGILSLIMIFNSSFYRPYKITWQSSQTILIIWNVIANFVLLTYFINMVMCISIGLQHKKLYPMMNLQPIWLLILLSCLGSFGALIIGMNIFITMRTYNKLNTLVEVSKTQSPSL